MKKLITFFSLLVVGMTTSGLFAKNYVIHRTTDEDVMMTTIKKQVKGVSDRRDAAQSLQADLGIFDDASYCRISKNGSTYDFELRDGDDDAIFKVKNVDLSLANKDYKNIINGGYVFPRYGSRKTDNSTYAYYLEDGELYEMTNPTGCIGLTFLDEYDSNGDPIYDVFIYVASVYYGTKNEFSMDYNRQIPVRLFNGNTKLTIDNTIINPEINIPGSYRITETFQGNTIFQIQGFNETYSAYFQTVPGIASRTGSFDNTDVNNDDGNTSIVVRASSTEVSPNVIRANVEQTNGFYFFEGDYYFANAIYSVSMQYPNYQASNTTFTETFTTDNTTIARSGDYATSGIVTLTAKNTNTHKGVRMDFVVDKLSATDARKIPAGTYSVSTSKETNTVVASPGINKDLTINNSFAGPLNGSNDFYVNTSTTLWCFRTGTNAVVVDYIGDKMRVRATNINSDYRSSAVNFSVLPTFNITYKDKGDVTFTGTQIGAPTTHTYGTATTLKIPTKLGYDFGGWFTASNCESGAVGNATAASLGATDYTANITLYAKWELKTYTAANNIDKNGGASNGQYTATYDATTIAINTAPIAATGYKLEGLYKEAACTNKIADASGNLQASTAYTDANSKWKQDGNVTLYAKWTQKTYTLSVTDNGSGYYSSATTISQTTGLHYGDAVTLTPHPAAGCYVSSWSASVSGTATANPVDNGDGTWTYTINTDAANNANFALTANFAINTYNVTFVVDNTDNWGTLSGGAEVSGGRKIASVPHGATITISNNTVTINGTTITATATSPNTAQYSYGFGSWKNGKTTLTGSSNTVTGTMTIKANFTRTTNTYDITFKNADGTTLKKLDGTTDAVYSVAYGETPVYNGATPTKDADSEYTYTFDSWTPAITSVTTAATYTATYSTTKVQYTLAWDVNGGNALTGTYTNGTIDWGTTINKPTDPTKAGYTFGGWDADNDGTADDVAATMPTSDVTYKALWNAISSDLVLKDGVSDGQTDINFDEFAATYNDQTMNTVTLNRTFTAGNWSTLCLPFNAPLSSSALKGNMFEFQHAHGNAQEGGGIYLYFSTATQIVAGRAYLVRFSKAPVSNSYTFTGFDGVKIDTDRDKSTLADLVAANTGENANQTEGTISLIGTLRKFVLPTPSANYMALYNNKIYYPGTNTTVPAYRAFFYDSNPASVQQRVRIVVDGVDMGEMLIDNGELLDADKAGDRAPRKYIRNGVLVIERNGVTYDAQGKRL